MDRWLDGCIKSIVKLSNEVATLDSLINGFIASIASPAQLSETIIDHDYTLLAVKRYGEGARDFWGSAITGMKKMEGTIVEPIRSFQSNELRSFKV